MLLGALSIHHYCARYHTAHDHRVPTSYVHILWIKLLSYHLQLEQEKQIEAVQLQISKRACELTQIL